MVLHNPLGDYQVYEGHSFHQLRFYLNSLLGFGFVHLFRFRYKSWSVLLYSIVPNRLNKDCTDDMNQLNNRPPHIHLMYICMANPTILNINYNVMVTRVPSFERVLTKRCFCLLSCVIPVLGSFLTRSCRPVKNVIYGN